MFLDDDQRRVRPRKEETEGGKRARSKRFLESLDSRLREIDERNTAWPIPAEPRAVVAAVEQAVPKRNSSKGQAPSNGSTKSDISRWFVKRTFSEQSSQGGSAATSHRCETGQASGHREQAVDHRTEGVVDAVGQMYTTSDQLLPEIAACVWFKAKKTEKCRFSLTSRTWSPLHHPLDFVHTALMSQERSCTTGLHPEDHK